MNAAACVVCYELYSRHAVLRLSFGLLLGCNGAVLSWCEVFLLTRPVDRCDVVYWFAACVGGGGGVGRDCCDGTPRSVGSIPQVLLHPELVSGVVVEIDLGGYISWCSTCIWVMVALTSDQKSSFGCVEQL